MILSHSTIDFHSDFIIFHSNLIDFRFFARARAPVPVLHHHPGCHCPPNSTGTPPTHPLALCHYHYPSPIDSKSTFCSKPYQTGMFSKNFNVFFQFLCTGPAPTTPAPPAQSARALAPPVHPSAHLRAPFHAPARTLCTFCAPLRTFSRTFVHPRAPLRSLCAPFAHICAPLRTFAHPCAPFHAHSHTSALPLHTFHTPSVHPCALCAPSSGFVTLI